MKYVALIYGGIGPNVWDREVEVEAEDIRQALDKVEAGIEGEGDVVSIEQEK